MMMSERSESGWERERRASWRSWKLFPFGVCIKTLIGSWIKNKEEWCEVRFFRLFLTYLYALFFFYKAIYDTRWAELWRNIATAEERERKVKRSVGKTLRGSLCRCDSFLHKKCIHWNVIRLCPVWPLKHHNNLFISDSATRVIAPTVACLPTTCTNNDIVRMDKRGIKFWDICECVCEWIFNSKTCP